MSDDRNFEIDEVFNLNAYFSWGASGFGFGQTDISLRDGVIEVDNECMSRETIRKIFHALVDHAIDRAVLRDPIN